MLRRPPRSTRTDTLFPYTTLFRSHGNFAVRTGALVEKILIEEGRATGVVIRRGKNRETLRARGGVVLSAGAFGSTQILMLSGIGPAAHLAGQGIEVVLDRAGVRANLPAHNEYMSLRSAETRVGKECVIKCKSAWYRAH